MRDNPSPFLGLAEGFVVDLLAGFHLVNSASILSGLALPFRCQPIHGLRLTSTPRVFEKTPIKSALLGKLSLLRAESKPTKATDIPNFSISFTG
jgi:hypothetical protein